MPHRFDTVTERCGWCEARHWRSGDPCPADPNDWVSGDVPPASTILELGTADPTHGKFARDAEVICPGCLRPVLGTRYEITQRHHPDRCEPKFAAHDWRTNDRP